MDDIVIAMRMMLACLLAGVIGWERQAARKSAGIRTHMLVSLASCLIMVLSIEMYKSVQGTTNADPARLAAQVVSGVGFLGAGVVWKDRSGGVVGLTTAATIWLVAGIGLGGGAGYYASSLMATFLGFCILTFHGRFSFYPHQDGIQADGVSENK